MRFKFSIYLINYLINYKGSTLAGVTNCMFFCPRKIENFFFLF